MKREILVIRGFAFLCFRGILTPLFMHAAGENGRLVTVVTEGAIRPESLR